MNPPIDVLHVPEDIFARLQHEARRCYPAEACGFLIGERQGTQASVHRLLAAENRAPRSDRFLIDARDVFDAMGAARRGGHELLGTYHSHPRAAPEPSATDRAAAWYEWLYLIVSVTSALRDEELRIPGPNMACWRWDGEEFNAVGLRSAAAAGAATR